MTTLTVTMSTTEAAKLGNEVHVNTKLLAKMRKLGIPVMGRISVQGVHHGTLTITRSGKDVVYRWDGDLEDDEL